MNERFVLLRRAKEKAGFPAVIPAQAGMTVKGVQSPIKSLTFAAQMKSLADSPLTACVL